MRAITGIRATPSTTHMAASAKGTDALKFGFGEVAMGWGTSL